MLNEVHLEGIVIRNEEFRATRLVRVAVDHDPGRSGVDASVAYITLRIEPPLAAVAATLQGGARVRVSGYIIHRDYSITLARFASVAIAENDDEAKEVLEQVRSLARRAGTRISKPHSTTEVVVERLHIL